MFKWKLYICVLCLLALPTVAAAQEEEAPALPFVYATYFECDTSREGLADDLFKRYLAPHYDAAVEDGEISGWGYLAHHTGGKWRRLIWRAAPTLSQAMASVGAIGRRVGEDGTSRGANREFGATCNSHVDYIWKSVASSGGGNIDAERGKVGFSAYYVCDENRETRADEIVKKSLAPLYDAQVEAGNLQSWGWMQHWVGGKYRRISTMTAKDVDTLMAARDSIVQSMIDMEEVGEEFSDICGSHSDYIWDIRIETR
jgi:hypothetical protein